MDRAGDVFSDADPRIRGAAGIVDNHHRDHSISPHTLRNFGGQLHPWDRSTLRGEVRGGDL